MTANPKLEPMGSDNLRANCEISDHRSLSRKGTFRGVDNKNTAKEKDVSVIATSPRGSLFFLLHRQLATHNLRNVKFGFYGKLTYFVCVFCNLHGIKTAAALLGGSTPEKPLLVAVGGDNNSINSPVHNQITIINGSMGNTAIESKFGGKRFSFRRASPSWTIDPRRILLFFATLSSIGTILLIYCTLHISNGDYNGQD